MAGSKTQRITEALSILGDLDLPKAQRNERTALCLLALLDLQHNKRWADSSNPLIGITPIMDWARENYDKDYAPNTRETVRRQSMHQFVAAGIALYNPDKPDRAVNSPAAVYQIEPTCFALLKLFGAPEYAAALAAYKAGRESLVEQYAMHREMQMIPVRTSDGRELRLSPGGQSPLLRAICEQFAPRYVPGGELLYLGDTGDKFVCFERERLVALGVTVDDHGKMPDVVLYYGERGWLVLAEAVTSHGPVDGKRHAELRELFRGSTAGLVFVSAFPDHKTYLKYAEVIAWETEVWLANHPTHLIHFNGDRFLGPY